MKNILIAILVMFSTAASAHSGRTNSQGCHNDWQNGGYHCHKSDEAKPQKREVASKKIKQPKSEVAEIQDQKGE